MARSLNTREKVLLSICLGTIFIAANGLGFYEFFAQRKQYTDKIKRLSDQVEDDQSIISKRPLWEKRQGWLDKHMPYTDSTGRAQGQLLDELQNSALDSQLKVTNQTLHETVQTEGSGYTEISLSLKVAGDQEILTRWLLSLQSPEKFVAIKGFDLQLDTKSKEKRPQAECNLTVAQWFNPEPPANYVAPGTPGSDVNPLSTPDPLTNQ